MKRLNKIRIPVLLALLLGLGLSSWAQKADGEASTGTPQTEMEAKKSLYKELGVKWTYEDGSSLEVAKSVISSSGLDGQKLEEMEREFQENQDAWFTGDPDKYNHYVKVLGLIGLPVAGTTIADDGSVIERTSTK